MKTYKVWVTKMVYGSVDVNANSEQEAKDKAYAEYGFDKIDWLDEEVCDLEPQEVKREKTKR